MMSTATGIAKCKTHHPLAANHSYLHGKIAESVAVLALGRDRDRLHGVKTLVYHDRIAFLDDSGLRIAISQTVEHHGSSAPVDWQRYNGPCQQYQCILYVYYSSCALHNSFIAFLLLHGSCHSTCTNVARRRGRGCSSRRDREISLLQTRTWPGESMGCDCIHF